MLYQNDVPFEANGTIYIKKEVFGRSSGLYVPIFLPWRKAKRISSSIPSAKPSVLKNLPETTQSLNDLRLN